RIKAEFFHSLKIFRSGKSIARLKAVFLFDLCICKRDQVSCRQSVRQFYRRNSLQLAASVIPRNTSRRNSFCVTYEKSGFFAAAEYIFCSTDQHSVSALRH